MVTMLGRARVLPVVAVLCLAGTRTAATEDADAPATSLNAVLDECGTLGLASTARHVKEKVAKLGHLEVTVNDGTAVPIVGKSGQVLGFYVEGSGGYRYTVSGAEDRASFAANVERVAKTLRAMDNGVTDHFSRMLVLSSGPVLPELWDTASGGEAAPAPANQSKFADLLKDAQGSFPEFDFRTALSRLNGKGRSVYVEFEGGLERAGYSFDEVIAGRERFFNFRSFSDYHLRYTQTLSAQPIEGWLGERGGWITLTKAAIALETADNKSGSIASELTLKVHDAGLRLVPFKLMNNRDADSPYWTSTKNQLTVKRVTGADGAELRFAHRYHELLVEIPPTASADSDVVIHVETAGEVFLDMTGHHSDNYFIFLTDWWFPSPLSWGGERFSYTLKVKTKKPWRPVTSGQEMTLRDEGDSFVAESRSEHASHIIAVLGGKYVTKTETIDGLTVRVHAYASARKNVIENLPKLTAALVKFYTGILGPMPAEELDVVEIPEYGFGISPSGVVLVTSEAYKAREDDITEYLSRGINARLAHEVAHQWFGHKAWPREVSDAWLNESFAEYFSGLAVGVLAGTDKTVVGFERMLAEWRADAKICADVAPITMASFLSGDSGRQDRRCLLYSRGPLVLHMLRTSVGNDRFNAATKRFLDTANTGPATTDDYAKAVSGVVGMDMQWFFDQWVRQAGTAQVTVEQHLDAGANGQYKLWGAVRQAPGVGFRKLLVPLVWEKDGKPDARVVFVDQPEKKFEFLLPFKPGSIKPDPFQNNLAVYK
jgi:hypothetical protein